MRAPFSTYLVVVAVIFLFAATIHYLGGNKSGTTTNSTLERIFK